jgi:hypothetical protein
LNALNSIEALRMPSDPVVTNDLAVKIGGRKVSLTPSAAFTLAEQLIRAGTRAMIVEEADRAAVLDTVRAAERT